MLRRRYAVKLGYRTQPQRPIVREEQAKGILFISPLTITLSFRASPLSRRSIDAQQGLGFRPLHHSILMDLWGRRPGGGTGGFSSLTVIRALSGILTHSVDFASDRCHTTGNLTGLMWPPWTGLGHDRNRAKETGACKVAFTEECNQCGPFAFRWGQAF